MCNENHSSDINFKDFINIYKTCTSEPYSFLVNDDKLHQIILWDLQNFFSTYNKIMTINDQIIDEKLQYGINRKAAKKSAWSSVKIDNYEYLTGKEISI